MALKFLFPIIFVSCVCGHILGQDVDPCRDLWDTITSDYDRIENIHIDGIKFSTNRKDSLDLRPYLDHYDKRYAVLIGCASENHDDYFIRVNGGSAYWDNGSIWFVNKTDYNGYAYGQAKAFKSYIYLPHCVVTISGKFVHYLNSDTYKRSLIIEDVLTKSEAEDLYVLKSEFETIVSNVSGLVSKVIKPAIPINFVVHGYNSVSGLLTVSYRGPFEYCIYYKGFVPFDLLGNGKSAGGDNVSIDLSSFISGTYWIVFIYAGESFRVQVIK